MKKIILIVLVIITILTFTACGSNSNLVSETEDTTVKATEETIEETTVEPTIEELTTQEPTTEEPTTEEPTEIEDEYIEVGETYSDNSLDIAFISAEDFTSYDEYDAPNDGNKVIRVYLEIKNNGSSEKGIGSWDFDCYVDNEIVDEWYGLDVNDEMDGYVNLSKGRIVKGAIYYEVPKNAKSIEIEYIPQYSIFDNDEPVIFKIK